MDVELGPKSFHTAGIGPNTYGLLRGRLLLLFERSKMSGAVGPEVDGPLNFRVRFRD